MPIFLRYIDLLTLEHCAKRIVGWNALSGAAPFFGCGLSVSERESDKETLAHFIFTFGHCLERLLFLMDLLVLGHVSFIGEVVEVTSICLRVQLRNKRCASLAEGLPADLGKVLMGVDILNVREASRPRVDTSRCCQ